MEDHASSQADDSISARSAKSRRSEDAASLYIDGRNAPDWGEEIDAQTPTRSWSAQPRRLGEFTRVQSALLVLDCVIALIPIIFIGESSLFE